MTLRIEHGDLNRWIVTMDKAVSAAPREATKVVSKGALNIKNDAQRRVGRPAHAPAYASSISYDLYPWFSGPTADIGPDKARRQGALGNILEFGTVKNAPIPHMIPSAEAESPRFERAMADLATRLLEGR